MPGDFQHVDMMLELQIRGCVNINFVTPTHVVPRIIESVFIANGTVSTDIKNFTAPRRLLSGVR
jgi:uncharacterized Fe-S radical SAM superfamily protein PflX